MTSTAPMSFEALCSALRIPPVSVLVGAELGTLELLELARHFDAGTELHFLDSARPPGRASYLVLGADLVVSARRHATSDGPDRAWVEVRAGDLLIQGEADPFEVLRSVLRARGPAPTDAPGFVSGGVGFLGYECGRILEVLTRRARKGLGLPDLRFVFTDVVFTRDEASGLTRLSVLGRGRDEPSARRSAEGRLAQLLNQLENLRAEPPSAGSSERTQRIESTHDARAYRDMVARAKEHIRTGDVFEVCVTQQFRAPSGPRDGVSLYEALRTASPAPYSAFFRFEGAEVLSVSPERFLCLSADRVAESRPIKGTRPRGRTPEEDARLREELGTAGKDRAENIMIVDLVRNDLGRVSELGSVTVPELCRVEAHPSVFQLVSTVRGHLRPGLDGIDLVKSCFPGGSMTGAPKIEAMKLIEELEPVERGIYSGALGYFDDRGPLSLSIVIRTFVRAGGWTTFSAGGAVVMDSDPAEEHFESLAKVRALARALTGSPWLPGDDS
ncbi:MAG: anthranilate synthase component I family protein [Deltaproteobacteria bacterium]|nr:anthranilate synthase component I family protein [Deltaproteobacteria bacterium]